MFCCAAQSSSRWSLAGLNCRSSRAWLSLGRRRHRVASARAPGCAGGGRGCMQDPVVFPGSADLRRAAASKKSFGGLPGSTGAE
jgi:hypothetical protein